MRTCKKIDCLNKSKFHEDLAKFLNIINILGFSQLLFNKYVSHACKIFP